MSTSNTAAICLARSAFVFGQNLGNIFGSRGNGSNSAKGKRPVCDRNVLIGVTLDKRAVALRWLRSRCRINAATTSERRGSQKLLRRDQRSLLIHVKTLSHFAKSARRASSSLQFV
jgi:hypothetical protein